MPHTYETLREAVVDAYLENRSAKRMNIITACGTGKTRQAISIHEVSMSQLTVVLEPTLSLISQTLEEWNAFAENGFEPLIVCSDPSVVDDDSGIIVSLDNRAIAEWMRVPSSVPKVLFTTYQSSYRLADIYRAFPDTPEFDLGLFDESHMAAVNDPNSLFATALK